MWHAVFLLIAVSGAALFVFSRRRFDICSLAFFAACFYFVPGLLGFTGYPEGVLVRAVPLEVGSYMVMSAVLGTVIIAGAIPLEPRKTMTQESFHLPQLSLMAPVSTGAAMLGAVMTLLTVGDALFDSDKFNLLDELNRWHLLWTTGATLGFVNAVLRGWRSLAAINLLLLLFNLYVGFRVDLVIAVLAAITVGLYRLDSGPLAKHWRIGLAIAVLGLCLFLYKYILVALKLMDIELLMAQLQNPEAFRLVFLYSEAFIAQGTLNEVIRQDFFVGPGHLVSCLYLLVPFANELGATVIGFHDLFQPALFSSVTEYGLGSNFWAEMLASGGWLMFVLSLLVFGLLLRVGNTALRIRSPEIQSVMLVIFVYLAFYIHRNDLVYQLTLTRRFVLAGAAFAGVSLLIYWLVRVGREAGAAPSGKSSR